MLRNEFDLQENLKTHGYFRYGNLNAEDEFCRYVDLVVTDTLNKVYLAVSLFTIISERVYFTSSIKTKMKHKMNTLLMVNFDADILIVKLMAKINQNLRENVTIFGKYLEKMFFYKTISYNPFDPNYHYGYKIIDYQKWKENLKIGIFDESLVVRNEDGRCITETIKDGDFYVIGHFILTVIDSFFHRSDPVITVEGILQKTIIHHQDLTIAKEASKLWFKSYYENKSIQKSFWDVYYRFENANIELNRKEQKAVASSVKSSTPQPLPQPLAFFVRGNKRS